MSPTSAITFIKCRNRHHMKNNIRYKVNINKTSVIIFFNCRAKTPNGVTMLGRTSSELFVILVVVTHSFLLFILLLFFIYCLFFIFVVVLHSLLFNVIPHASVDYRQVFTPILYFQPSTSQSDSRRDTFILTFPRSSFTVLPRALRF